MSRKPEQAPAHQALFERASAYHETMVFLNETYPNFALMAYNHGEGWINQIFLLKCVTGIEYEGDLLYNDCTDDSRSDNLPGMLKGVYPTQNGDVVTVEMAPLTVGQADKTREGGMIVRISTQSGKNPQVRFAAGKKAFMHYSPNPEMSGNHFDYDHASAVPEDGILCISRNDCPLITCVRVENLSLENGIATAVGQNGILELTAGFAADAQRSRMIAQMPVDFTPIRNYYDQLIDSSRIDTPDSELNEAFTHAILNMEYSWQRPLGWIECIQHWPTFWHMEHIAFANWLGQEDRSLECLETLLQHLFENGAVPDMNPGGSTRRDWGGNNQFFFRELLHYTLYTGDLGMLKKAEPYLEKILFQTLHEYDPAGNGVIGWNTQIGNQEDMETTPGPGGAPGIEGVRMLEIMSRFMALLGREKDRQEYDHLFRTALAAWRRLILKDGLPIWYRDTSDMPRLDPTYHGLCYPVLYGYLTPEEAAHFMDHLTHRLVGEDGEIYQSHHFGDHAYWGVPTWGMQCGSNMQPFATRALCMTGRFDDAIKPMQFIAQRVCGPYQRGSFPETANEKRLAYFSPSAAVFGEGIVEGVFGLKKDHDTLCVAPGFPSHWDHASIKLPHAAMEYCKSGNINTFCITHSGNIRFAWKVAPFAECEVLVNGIRKEYSVRGGCDYVEIMLDIPCHGQTEIKVWMLPANYAIACTPCVHEGGKVSILAENATFIGIKDLSCGTIAAMQPLENGVSLQAAKDILPKEYGWFGKIQFARRCLCAQLKLGDLTFSRLCPVTVLPEYTISSENGRLCMQGLSGDGVIRVAGHTWPLADTFPTDDLLPGKNRAEVIVDGVSYPFTAEFDAPDMPIRQIDISQDRLLPEEAWNDLGRYPHHGQILIDADNFLKDIFKDMPALHFPGIAPLKIWNGFLPLSREKYPIQTISLTGLTGRKAYIALCGFLNNQDMFSQPFRVELEAEKGDAFIRPIAVKRLHLPGDLDFGYGLGALFGFHSFEEGVARSSAWMPEFPENGDYPNAQGPSYPQRTLWSQNRACAANHAVFTLVEMELGREMPLKEVRIYCESADAAGGVFAVGVI